MSVLVTGAKGFIGSALCESLRADAVFVRGAVRTPRSPSSNIEYLAVGRISAESDWSTVLDNIRQVVHLATCAQFMNKKSHDHLGEFYRVNVEGTANLARQAAASGVKRFIFLSSIKVNGEYTELGRPFTADHVPAPKDPYSMSKHEAERVLREIAVGTKMEVVIIRAPLVYGPNVKANFESMMRWIARGLPLPLAAATKNRRSFIAIDNLVNLIVTCLNHPAAANQTFLVSDGEDLSTAELLRRMGYALGCPARLFYTPPGLFKLGALLLPKPGIYQRLYGSLQLDISKTRRVLGWSPPVSVSDGLLRAAQGFRS